MSWSFKVGDKVVAIRNDSAEAKAAAASSKSVGIIIPKSGAIYTIRDILVSPWSGKTCLRLGEIRNRNFRFSYGVFEPFFVADNFRPLVSEGMKTLRSLLAPSDVKEPA